MSGRVDVPWTIGVRIAHTGLDGCRKSGNRATKLRGMPRLGVNLGVREIGDKYD